MRKIGLRKEVLVVSLMCFFLGLNVSIALALGDNMIGNPGFEERDGKEFRDWALESSLPVGGEYGVSEDAHSGKNALKITLDPFKEGDFWYAQGIQRAITPGTKYYAECWVKKENGFRVLILIKWRGAGQETLICAWQAGEAVDEYRKFSKEIEAPEGTTSATFFIFVDWFNASPTAPATLLIDDVVFKRSTSVSY